MDSPYYSPALPTCLIGHARHEDSATRRTPNGEGIQSTGFTPRGARAWARSWALHEPIQMHARPPGTLLTDRHSPTQPDRTRTRTRTRTRAHAHSGGLARGSTVYRAESRNPRPAPRQLGPPPPALVHRRPSGSALPPTSPATAFCNTIGTCNSRDLPSGSTLCTGYTTEPGHGGRP